MFEKTTKSQIKNLGDVQKELELLRKLVLELSSKEPKIIPTLVRDIETVPVPYQPSPWYEPYKVWCSTTSESLLDTTITGGTITDETINIS